MFRLWLGRALMVWGALTLIGGGILAGYVALRIGPGDVARVDHATPHDVRFVLNWCELGESRIKRVVHSHMSPRNITGDHLDAYAIEISNIEPHELKKKGPYHRWYRGDEVPPVLNDAIEFVGGWLHEIPWFPPDTELRTDDYYVYPWAIEIHGVKPTAAQLIFIRPSDRMVFYFSGKT
jgi:hypothetical protein